MNSPTIGSRTYAICRPLNLLNLRETRRRVTVKQNPETKRSLLVAFRQTAGFPFDQPFERLYKRPQLGVIPEPLAMLAQVIKATVNNLLKFEVRRARIKEFNLCGASGLEFFQSRRNLRAHANLHPGNIQMREHKVDATSFSEVALLGRYSLRRSRALSLFMLPRIFNRLFARSTVKGFSLLGPIGANDHSPYHPSPILSQCSARVTSSHSSTIMTGVIPGLIPAKFAVNGEVRAVVEAAA